MSLDALNLLFTDADAASDDGLPLAVDALIEFMDSDPRTIELIRIAEAKTQALHRSLRDDAIKCMNLVLTEIARQPEAEKKTQEMENNIDSLLATLATAGNDTQFLLDLANRYAIEVSPIVDSSELHKVLRWTKYLKSKCADHAANDPSLALRKIKEYGAWYRRKPPALELSWDDLEWLNDYGHSSSESSRGKWDSPVQAKAEWAASNIKLLLKRMQTGLRIMFHSVSTRFALLQRYKARCEAFDRERLLALCEQGPAGTNKGKPEDRLVADAAKFLFDERLPTMFGPEISGVRPDLFAMPNQEVFYVEAKQSDNMTESYVLKCYAQLLTTSASLRAQYPGYRFDESFLVFFRRGGPICSLPESMVVHGHVVHTIVIDLDARGSKAPGKTVYLSKEEILNRVKTEKSTADVSPE